MTWQKHYDDMDCSYYGEETEEVIMTNQMFRDGKDYMQGIIENLYSDEDLNIDYLENCVEELAHLFDLKIPAKFLNLSRKEHLEQELPKMKITKDDKFFFDYAANLSRSYL